MMDRLARWKRRLLDDDDVACVLLEYLALAAQATFAAEALEAGVALGPESADLHALLDRAVDTACREAFGAVDRRRLFLMRLPEHAFVHGVVLVSGRSGMLLYFEDVGIGLLAFIPGMGRRRVHVVRFRGSDATFALARMHASWNMSGGHVGEPRQPDPAA